MRERRGDQIDRLRDLRQSALHGGRNLGVFTIDDAGNFERGLAIEIGGRGVGFSVPRRAGPAGCFCVLRLCASRLLPQGFNHRVVKRRAHLFDGLILAVGPGAVGQQSYRKLALRVDPQRRAGVTEVSERTGRKYFPIATGRGRVPAERARSAFGRGFPARKEFDRIRAQNRMSAVEHGVGENGQIFGGREQAGVSRNAAEDAGVFVLHLALNDAMAEAAIVGGGRDESFKAGAGLKVVCVMPSGPKIRAGRTYRAIRRPGVRGRRQE
jgi:hypothetical protein